MTLTTLLSITLLTIILIGKAIKHPEWGIVLIAHLTVVVGVGIGWVSVWIVEILFRGVVKW